MSYTAYVVPTQLLDVSPPPDEWHATASEGDPSQSLVVIEWSGSNSSADFEAQPGVVLVGLPWEMVPIAAVPLLALFQPQSLSSSTLGAATTPSTPAPDTPPTPQPVSAALRQIAWPGARLVR